MNFTYGTELKCKAIYRFFLPLRRWKNDFHTFTQHLLQAPASCPVQGVYVKVDKDGVLPLRKLPPLPLLKKPLLLLSRPHPLNNPRKPHLIRWPVKRPEYPNTQWFLAGAKAFALK